MELHTDQYLEGPTDRERWMVTQIIRSAALVVDATHSADEDEREYGHGELVMIAKSLIDGEHGLSMNQLENLRDFVELIIDVKEKRRTKIKKKR